MACSASYRVLPEIKEYERTSTTVVNAYLLPIMRRYLENLAQGLAGIGIRAPLLVIASNGGVVGARAAGEKPVSRCSPDRPRGVAGAARLGTRCGDAEPHRVRHGWHHRQGLARGGRARLAHVRVRIPGGHQHAEPLHQGRRLHAEGAGHRRSRRSAPAPAPSPGSTKAACSRVGPESAGAAPGPACYGIGGTRPTVTDANVALGFLNPAYLAGGELKIDATQGEAAIAEHVARPLGLSVREAAHGIREVANASMARAIRSVTIERGRDPRDFTLVAFGGSGPVHAVDLARALEIPRVLVPVAPGVFTAVGMLASDVEHHFVRAHAAPLARLEVERANRAVDAMAEEARATLDTEGYAEAQIHLDFGCDLRYAGQASELTISAPRRALRRGRARRASPGIQRGVRRNLWLRHRRAARAGELAPRRLRRAAGPARLPRRTRGGPERRAAAAAIRLLRARPCGGGYAAAHAGSLTRRRGRRAPRPRHHRVL
jgi:N-methylhydantoinase A